MVPKKGVSSMVWNFYVVGVGLHPANIATSVQHCFYDNMASRLRTTSYQRWNNVVYVNVETFCISTLNWTTLDNIKTTLSFSTSILTTFGNVETTLRIWEFEKKVKPRFKNKITFFSFKEYAGLKMFLNFFPF